jgi:hypothetical protein
METLTIKQEIHQLIDQVQDGEILQAVYELLNKEKINLALKAEMTRRAKLAEEDIKAGRVYTLEEAQKITRECISKWKP